MRHEGRTKFARVKVPDVLPRFVPIPHDISGRRGITFAFLEDVIRMNLDELFPGIEVTSAHLFRSSATRTSSCTRTKRTICWNLSIGR